MNKITNFLVKGLTNKALKKVKGIVIHYVANPGSKASGNRNYWENRGDGVAAHYIVDLDGTIMHTVPNNMMAYHVGSKTYTQDALNRLSAYPNDCTIGIELTHPGADGKPSQATYNATVKLTAELCKLYGLTEKDVWTHKEVVGWKICHKWFVENPAEWTKFKNLVGQEIKGTVPTTSKPVTVNKPVTSSKPVSKPVDVTPNGVLKFGMKGEAVKQLQVALTKAGFNCGTPDGDFGGKTLDALKRFQSVYCNPADGVYGPATKQKLDEILKKK